MKKLLILFIFSNLLFSEVSKKIIYYGWGTRDTIYVRENWEKMEQMPFDGIGINVCIDRKKGPVDTGNILGWHLFGNKEFKYDDFKEAIEDLKIPKWTKFKDNFLPACICSTAQDYNFNWFDEDRWKIIKNNWKVYVRIAKEGNLKGIIIDPEHYGTYFFHYPSMKQRFDKSFEEYKKKVYERGRELMKITNQIYPDITILFFWTHSYLVLHPTEKLKGPETNSYGLLPSFVDGFIDESDERVKIFDICEFAYGAKERIQFLEFYHSIVNKASKFSQNPERYRKKIRVGFGLWLDNGGYGHWDVNDFSKNYFSPEEFYNSLKTALEISDEYVWIYSHIPKFFPRSNLPEEYLKAIERAKKEEKDE